jgi:hypothetical protein
MAKIHKTLRARAMTDRYFVFLEPLPPGQHEADLNVSVLNPIESSYNYNADWTHNLISETSKNSTGQ